MLRDLQFFTLDGLKITHSDILPYEPVIMMKEQSEHVVLAADGINLATHQTDIFTAEHGNFKFLIPLYPGLSRLGDNIAEHRENFHLFLVSGTDVFKNLICLHLQRLRRGTTGPRLSQQTATPLQVYRRGACRTKIISGFSQSRSQMT